MDVLRLDHNIIAGEMFDLKPSGGLSASTILRITLHYGIIVIIDMPKGAIERWRISKSYQRITRRMRISINKLVARRISLRYFEEHSIFGKHED